jgi:hypothetical protein
MLKNMLVDGSLQDYYGRNKKMPEKFPTEIQTLLDSKREVKKVDDTVPSLNQIDILDSKQFTSEDECEISDDEDPIVIQMLDSMLPKNT